MSFFAFAYGLVSTVIALLLVPGAIQRGRADDRPMIVFGVAVGLICGLLGFAAWALHDTLPLYLNVATACTASFILTAVGFRLLVRTQRETTVTRS